MILSIMSPSAGATLIEKGMRAKTEPSMPATEMRRELAAAVRAEPYYRTQALNSLFPELIGSKRRVHEKIRLDPREVLLVHAIRPESLAFQSAYTKAEFIAFIENQPVEVGRYLFAGSQQGGDGVYMISTFGTSGGNHRVYVASERRISDAPAIVHYEAGPITGTTFAIGRPAEIAASLPEGILDYDTAARAKVSPPMAGSSVWVIDGSHASLMMHLPRGKDFEAALSDLLIYMGSPEVILSGG